MFRNTLLLGLFVCAAVITGCTATPMAGVERDVQQVSGLIVRFSSHDAKRLSRENLPPPQVLIDELIKLSKTTMTFRRAMSLESFVFDFAAPMSWSDAQVIVNRIKQSPSIERVEPDAQATHSLVPGAINYPEKNH